MKRWHVLDALIKRNGFKSVVELGIWKGATMAPLLALNPDIKYIGIDLYAPQPDGECETYLPDDNGHAWDHEAYYDNAMRIVEAHPNATVIRDYTTAPEVLDSIPAGSIDLVFIDADHSYTGARADIDAWLTKIRPGGIICGHDYCNDFPGVMEAVDESFAGRVKLYDDTVWAVVVSENDNECCIPDRNKHNST